MIRELVRLDENQKRDIKKTSTQLLSIAIEQWVQILTNY